MKNKYIALAFILLFGAGCNLAPKYQTPDMAVNQSWGGEEIYPQNEEFSPEGLDTQNFIRDERILAVVAMAVSGNRGLRAQLSDVEAARALYKVERSKLLPNIYAGGNTAKAETISGAITESYGLDIGLSSFEIDLFGKNRNLKDSKLEQYLASEQAAESARISLIAETVNAWMTLAADMELLKIAKQTVNSAAATADIANRRFNSGVSSKLDLYQAQTILFQAKADIENYTTIVAQDINALELLAGEKVPQYLLPEGLSEDDSFVSDVNAGVSSEVLLRRPDIKAAEHTLKSANADIGAARAAFFPNISLVGAAGLASLELSGLFSDNTKVWSYSGNINLPIFSGGKNVANLKYAKAKYQTYVAQYDKAIQTAFKEVKDALARKATINNQLKAQNELLTAAKEGYGLAQMRYEKGVETYLSVLESQRTFYNAEKAMVSTFLTGLNNRVALYKALGGGAERVAQN